MADPSGTICVTCYSDDPFLEMFESTGGGGGGYTGAAFAHQYVKDAHGEGAVAEGYGSASSNRYGAEVYAQKFYYSYDFLAIEDDGITLVDGSLGMIQATLSWWDGFLSLTPVDWFGAELSSGVSLSKGLHFSALAYIMAVSGTVDFGIVEISATGYVGAIGVEFAAGFSEVTIGVAPNGVGGSITIRWDTE